MTSTLRRGNVSPTGWTRQVKVIVVACMSKARPDMGTTVYLCSMRRPKGWS